MPLPLKPPSRVDPLSFPVFGISWFADAGTGLSLIAYCGGGGSAKTGVNNNIFVSEPDGGTKKIETGEQVGVAVKIVQHPMTRTVWLLVALGKKVDRYHLPSTKKSGSIEVGGDGVNAIAVSSMADRLACGCENGDVNVYEISDKLFDTGALLYTCKGHTKTVCSLDFARRDIGRMVSSAKDGTARVWQDEECVAELTCSVDGGSQSAKSKIAPKRPVQVLVRGCAFQDLDGHEVLTVASARKGSAFLSRWYEQEAGKFECERTEVSPVPISAMSLSEEGPFIALGAVDGTIILWSLETWKPMKVFKEVHDLPVTCIAARPVVHVPLQGDEEGIIFHAISASADSRLAHLSLQRRGPKKPGDSDGSLITFLWNLLLCFMVLYIAALRPLLLDAQDKCAYEWHTKNFAGLGECLWHEVLIAPASHPGVSIPPY
jgi:WD40 repeat protein